MSNLFGFVSASGGQIFGKVDDLNLSTSVLTIPALGVGKLNPGIMYDSSNTLLNLRIVIESPLPSSVGTLTVLLKNLTTGNTMGNLNVSSGSTTGTKSGSLIINQGDQVALLLSVSGDAVFVPGLQWYTF